MQLVDGIDCAWWRGWLFSLPRCYGYLTRCHIVWRWPG